MLILAHLILIAKDQELALNAAQTKKDSKSACLKAHVEEENVNHIFNKQFLYILSILNKYPNIFAI